MRLLAMTSMELIQTVPSSPDMYVSSNQTITGSNHLRSRTLVQKRPSVGINDLPAELLLESVRPGHVA